MTIYPIGSSKYIVVRPLLRHMLDIHLSIGFRLAPSSLIIRMDLNPFSVIPCAGFSWLGTQITMILTKE
jgi:hypothetical protein